jgi:hypothetical protein
MVTGDDGFRTFANVLGASQWIDEVITLGDPDGVKNGRYGVEPIDLPDDM